MSLSVNEAIERAHSEGILSTTSLMVGGAAAGDAVQRARRLPELKVGLHLVVSRDRSVLSPAEIPDLVDGQGRFADNLVRAGVRYYFRPAVRSQLEHEVRAQFEAFRRTGLPLDHVNAHNHMHLHPTVLGLILEVGREYGLDAVRVPHEPFLPSWRATRERFLGRLLGSVFLTPWLALMRRRLRRAGVHCNDYVFGLNDSGRMVTDRVLGYMAHLPEGVSEIYFHPAVSGSTEDDAPQGLDTGQRELAALTDTRVLLCAQRPGIRRMTFSNLRADAAKWSARGDGDVEPLG